MEYGKEPIWDLLEWDWKGCREWCEDGMLGSGDEGDGRKLNARGVQGRCRWTAGQKGVCDGREAECAQVGAGGDSAADGRAGGCVARERNRSDGIPQAAQPMGTSGATAGRRDRRSRCALPAERGASRSWCGSGTAAAARAGNGGSAVVRDHEAEPGACASTTTRESTTQPCNGNRPRTLGRINGSRRPGR